MTNNIAILLILGLMVNGPYALITTSVSADLGTDESLSSSSRALATVTAIIDGTGSIGNYFYCWIWGSHSLSANKVSFITSLKKVHLLLILPSTASMSVMAYQNFVASV